MTPLFSFTGIYTPIVSPILPDGRVHKSALEYFIEAGVHGLISGGSTGENYAQTVAERIEIAQFT